MATKPPTSHGFKSQQTYLGGTILRKKSLSTPAAGPSSSLVSLQANGSASAAATAAATREKNPDFCWGKTGDAVSIPFYIHK